MKLVSHLRSRLRRRPDAPIPERRADERQACAIPALLFDKDGMASSATILDRSQGGVRVTFDVAGSHDTALYILRLDTGAAYRLRCTWVSPTLAGYEFKERVDGSSGSCNRAVDALRTAWIEHQSP